MTPHAHAASHPLYPADTLPSMLLAFLRKRAGVVTVLLSFAVPNTTVPGGDRHFSHGLGFHLNLADCT
jgi:hypothetical protein